MSSLPTTSLPLGVDLSAQENGLYAGFVMATGFLGITVVQAWIYVNNNKDQWPLRTFVAVLVILDVTTAVLNAVFVHHYLIKNFGNLAELSKTHIAVSIELLITIIITCLVEIFFATRVHKLSIAHWAVPVFIVLTALAGLGTGLAGTVEVFRYPVTSTVASPKVVVHFALRNVFAVLSDIAATAALLWSFNTSRTGFKSTDTLLQKLFQYTVTRGLFVTVFQVCVLATYTAQPATLNWFPFHLGESKIYVITVVSMLNSRSNLRVATEISISDSEFVVTRPRTQTTSTTVGEDTNDPESGYVLNSVRLRSSIGDEDK